MRYPVSWLVVLALLAPAAHAQATVADIVAGARVRVTDPSANLQRTHAIFLGTWSDSLYLTVARAPLEQSQGVRDSVLIGVPFDGVTRLDVRRRDGLSATGAGVGAIVGVVLTASGGMTAVAIGGSFGTLIGMGGAHAVRTGLTGAALGWLPGAVLGIAAGNSCARNNCWVGPSGVGDGLILGAMAGAVMGYIGGSVVGLVLRGEWHNVALRRPRVSMTPYIVPGAAGASVSIGF